MPYFNVLPHRLNGPRESLKYNVIDGELIYMEKLVANKISTLLSTIEDNKDVLSLSTTAPELELDVAAFSYAFSSGFLKE